jgi:hypothetical protein
MARYEIKVELLCSESIKDIIEKTYFEEGDYGKILNKNNYLKIEESDDINYSIFKGLNNVTVKILNNDIIDGHMRFMVDETDGDVRLYPISIYCIREDKYSFY